MNYIIISPFFYGFPILFIWQVIHPIMQESPRRRSVSSDKDFSECGRQGPAGETITHVVIALVKIFTMWGGTWTLFRLIFPSVHFSVKPRKGDALLFFSLYPNAVPDPASLHAGCPVDEGEKWSATKWIHVDSFDKIVGAGGNCTDANENCERWASLGECTKNPEYMIGSSDLLGYCRKSCKVC